jgi:hypothetical protein
MEVLHLGDFDLAAPLPDWCDINIITKDLRDVLDTLDPKKFTDRAECREMRISIAKTIALMREEKAVENRITLAKDILVQLDQFRLRNAGIART